MNASYKSFFSKVPVLSTKWHWLIIELHNTPDCGKHAEILWNSFDKPSPCSHLIWYTAERWQSVLRCCHLAVRGSWNTLWDDANPFPPTGRQFLREFWEITCSTSFQSKFTNCLCRSTLKYSGIYILSWLLDYKIHSCIALMCLKLNNCLS